MRILLFGEYSGVYTELRDGFHAWGHETFFISDGDGSKKYESDYLLPTLDEKHIKSKLFRILQPSFRLGLKNICFFLKNWKVLKRKITGFDAVLFINPVVYDTVGSWANLIIARYVIKHNKHVFLSVLGDDYYVLKYYSANNLQNGFYKSNFHHFIYPGFTFKYIYCLGYRFLNHYVVKHSKSVFPGVLNYAKAYKWSNKVTRVYPFPISADKLGVPFTINDNQPIIIFHGWQPTKESRKGNDVFDRVIRKVVHKYGEDRVKYQVVSGVPYAQYVKMFNSCHIFIDQLYAQDKGVNGLLGMAAGKVVFSGFNSDALQEYNAYNGELIGIRSYNDETYLFDKFCELIENPRLMEEISKNAIEFVNKNHLTNDVAKLYIDEIEKF